MKESRYEYIEKKRPSEIPKIVARGIYQEAIIKVVLLYANGDFIRLGNTFSTRDRNPIDLGEKEYVIEDDMAGAGTAILSVKKRYPTTLSEFTLRQLEEFSDEKSIPLSELEEIVKIQKKEGRNRRIN